MKTTGGLFARLVEPAHLHQSLQDAARGKRRRAEVAWALFNADAILLDLGRALERDSWAPAGFSLLRIQEPKRRVIARAPFVDRIVHTAVTALLEPVFLPSTLPEDIACRVGGGVHRAHLRLQAGLRAHRFAVHLDIRSFFASVDLDLLRGLVARRIRDARFLGVLDQILRSGAGVLDEPGTREWLGLGPDWPPPGRGLPVGAHTSQFLATHVYLAGLDHFVKRSSKVPGYLRYGDDLFLFGDRRADLRRWRGELGRWLAEERHLRLKHPGARVLACAGHLDGLGARISREEIRVNQRAMRRFGRRIRDALREPNGRGRRVRLVRSVAAAVGLLRGG